jgi:hypothetical protein
MGFMDKARKMAEQAQHKIDEKQKQWNQREGQEDAPGAGAVVFDDHGRPVPNETSEAQEEAGIPVGESMQAEPGTIPAGASHSAGETPSAHDTVEGERPGGVEHPGEGQPPAGRVEQSGAAGNAEENQSSSSGADTSPDPFKRPD